MVLRAFGVLLLGFAVPCLLSAQESVPTQHSAVVSFAFERVGMQVPKYMLRISEDGTGIYQGEEMAPKSPYPGVSSPAQPIDRTFTVTAATASKIFALARESNRFHIDCASKAKNIADTGKKTLSYQGSGGEGSCTYNYSENKSVTQLTDIFQGLAETMDEGRQLDHLHRYDRLGLDEAFTYLAAEVTAGRSIELGTIQTTLLSIAADTEVMQRVRTRATAMLATIQNQAASK